MEIAALHKLFLAHRKISIDSRNVPKGSLYFALSGPNFNGNDFTIQALDQGASFVIVDRVSLSGKANHLLVNNVLETLQALGTYHRNYCKATVISLTGSNGKTTTKELIYRVLSETYNTVATKGNLNNHIGVPLSLLSITEDTEFAVIEMGANHQGEIAFLSQLAQPDFGCITNFGKAHLEGFGGVEGVIKGKSELYCFLIAHKKPILYYCDDPIQKQKLAHYPNLISFGSQATANYTTTLIKGTKKVTITFQGIEIPTQLYGNYNATNCMIAASIGAYFKVPLTQIKKAIGNYQSNNNRSELKIIGKHKVILDAYNANPSSMEAAISHFSSINPVKGYKKTVLLGDMLELGNIALEEHQSIVNQLEKSSIDCVFLVGELFSKTQNYFKNFKNFTEFQSYFLELKMPASLLLIKGSRGMALERILPFLEKTR